MYAWHRKWLQNGLIRHEVAYDASAVSSCYIVYTFDSAIPSEKLFPVPITRVIYDEKGDTNGAILLLEHDTTTTTTKMLI